MKLNYVETQSTVKPLEIDIDSSGTGVYIRRNIKEVENEGVIYYQYQEAFITKSEYEQVANDLLVGEINGEDNSAEYEEYKNKLNTPVQYVNGHYYKPKWISLYSPIIDEFAIKTQIYEKAGGDIAPIMSIRTPIYDVTGKAANAVLMSVKEVIDLWLYLYQIKEQYFAEYKKAVAGDEYTEQ